MLSIKNHKVLAIAIAFVFCVSFLAPSLIAPPAAEAAAAYRTLTVPTLPTNSPAANLGVIEVDIPSGFEISAGDILSLTLPAGASFAMTPGIPPTATNGVSVVYTPSAVAVPEVEVVVPAQHPLTGMANGLTAALNGHAANKSILGYPDVTSGAKIGATGQSIDILFTKGTAGRGVLYIYLNNVALAGVSGDLTVSLMGSSSALPMGSVIVGKASTTGATMAQVKSVRTMGTAPTALDTITLVETSVNTFNGADTLKLKLPVGFSWTVAGQVGPNWGWAGKAGFAAAINADTRVLDVTIPAAAATGVNTTTGRLDILGATIKVDDSVARKGDVTVSVSSSSGKATAQDIVVAKYGDYQANAVEGSVKELTAGKSGQKLGTFFIEEEIPGSIVPNRVIKLTLPEGVKWWGGYRTGEAINGASVIKGGVALPATVFTVGASDNGSSDNGRSIQTTITNAPTDVAGKIEFKDLKVDVAPNFKGEVTVTVSGAAGATGEVKVADVIPAVELSTETTKNIIIGQQKQLAGELLIKESKKEKIAFRNSTEWVSGTVAATNAAQNNREITLTLPAGARWADLPKVEIIEGDLQLDLNAMSDGSVAAGGADNRRVTIPVKSSSLTPSTIKVSNILVTLDRTVPEGDFKVSIGGLAVNEVPNVFPQASLPSQVIAKVVTPAPTDGTAGAAAGQFKIDSNIYYVGGVAKVMDAAPYIKSDRTYVPMRFLGEMLGAEVVWDDAARTVTLTKGDDVVVFTIGSTSYTVNGEAKTADVAPEINNSRTMLPARFVAEALGAVVGWDPGTQTVLISN